MELKLIALSETDGEAVYRMLQEMPAQENGFINPMHGNPTANSARGCKAA